MEHAIPQEDHLNLGASIRRHVRRNRNLFSGHSNNRQGPTNNSHPDLRNESREQDPLLAEGRYYICNPILSGNQSKNK
jgi:hypothetical protein